MRDVRHPQPVAAPRCPECRPSLHWARQACAYDGAAPALLTALKDAHRRDLAPVLARVVALRCPPPPPEAVLVPVPLTPARRRRRGFNQSELLARHLARHWRLPVAPHALGRLRNEPAQRGAGRSARARQVAGAFAAAAPAPRVCCLVDDVHTTGATLGACAAALRRAGARSVGAVCVARAVRR